MANRRRHLLTVLIMTTALLSSGTAQAAGYSSTVKISSNIPMVQSGGTVEFTGTVSVACAAPSLCPNVTGTLTWDDGDSGGFFANNTCILPQQSPYKCSVEYSAPAIPGMVGITVQYSGGNGYSPAMAGSTFEVVPITSAASTTQSNAITSSPGQPAPSTSSPSEFVLILLVVGLGLLTLGAVYVREGKRDRGFLGKDAFL